MMEALIFSPFPGRRERQLCRKYKNTLFPVKEQAITANQLETAQYMDEQERIDFDSFLHDLIEQIANMQQNVSSELILKYKAQLDEAFEQCSRLSGEKTANKKIIIQLINVLMKAVWQGATGDQQALVNLKEEEIAREQHVDLLQIPLVADLLDPQSQVTENDFIAVLLTEAEENLSPVLSLFTPEQLHQITEDAGRYLQNSSNLEKTHPAWNKLDIIKNYTANAIN
jgi:hypothetical protein